MCLPYFYPKAIANAVASSAGSNVNFAFVTVLSATVFIVFACDSCITCILLVPLGGAEVNVKDAPSTVYAKLEPNL